MRQQCGFLRRSCATRRERRAISAGPHRRTARTTSRSAPAGPQARPILSAPCGPQHTSRTGRATCARRGCVVHGRAAGPTRQPPRASPRMLRPAVDQGALPAEGVLVDVRPVRGVAIAISRGRTDVGPDRRSGAPAGSAGQGAPHGRMLHVAARPLIQTVAHLPQAHGNASTRRNQSAAEMLWRSAVSIVKYSADFRHVHIRFTMPPRPIIDVCVRKTTANSATDR